MRTTGYPINVSMAGKPSLSENNKLLKAELQAQPSGLCQPGFSFSIFIESMASHPPDSKDAVLYPSLQEVDTLFFVHGIFL